MWISIRSQQLGNPNPNPKQQTPSQLGRAKAEFHQLWGSAEFLLQRRYHVSVDARRCGGFPRVIDEKGASNWSYLVGEPGVKIHKWQEWRNTRNKNTHVICQFSLAADFVFFIFCQDLSQRCWLVAPTNRRSGWFTNARHAGDRGWNLKDLLRARVLSVALWVPDGCEDPLVFVNEPPPCQKNSCDSASPWFFLYVVKPPLISAELVQLDSSYTSAAVSRLSSPGYWPLWVVFAAPISRSPLGCWHLTVSVWFEQAGRYWHAAKKGRCLHIGVHSRRIFCKLEFWSWYTATCFTHLCVF